MLTIVRRQKLNVEFQWEKELQEKRGRKIRVTLLANEDIIPNVKNIEERRESNQSKSIL